MYNLKIDESWKLDDELYLMHNIQDDNYYLYSDPGGHDRILDINIYKLHEVLQYIINNERN